MTVIEEIKRRIELKKQLIALTNDEIERLHEILINLEMFVTEERKTP
jgi:hypothetical protein